MRSAENSRKRRKDEVRIKKEEEGRGKRVNEEVRIKKDESAFARYHRR